MGSHTQNSRFAVIKNQSHEYLELADKLWKNIDQTLRQTAPLLGAKFPE